MFLETVFPPIPSEVISRSPGSPRAGQLSYGLVVAAGTAGAMLGNILWYLAARALGIVRLKTDYPPLGRWINDELGRVERAEALVRVPRTFFVFVGRLLPTVRSLVRSRLDAQEAVSRFSHRVDARHRGLDRDPGRRPVNLGQNYGDIDKILGPPRPLSWSSWQPAMSPRLDPPQSEAGNRPKTQHGYEDSLVSDSFRRVGGRDDRHRAAAPHRPRYKSGSTTGWHDRAVLAATASLRRAPANASRNYAAMRVG